jgi:3-isopropylmalate/(R)-2-methylmalate dehydratase small subunit
MFNCGMLAIELPEDAISKLFRHNDGTAEVTVDLRNDTLTISSGRGREAVPFQITKFDKALVEAGGWVDFADAKY